MLSKKVESPIQILLVDDHPLLRMGFMMLLRNMNPGFVFHEAGDRAGALELVTRHSPDVVLLDLTLGNSMELSMVGEIQAKSPGSSILVVSMHDERLYAERVLQAGAKGYVMKSHASRSVTEAVQTVLAGKVWLSEDMRNILVSRIGHSSEKGNWDKIASLTDRELEVFRLLGLGLKKAEMASQLQLSGNTIETHRRNIKLKLGISTGAELYRFAFLHFQNTDPIR